MTQSTKRPTFHSPAVDAALSCAASNVAWPDEVLDKFGFVILHQDEEAGRALVHLLVNDILRQFGFFAPLNDIVNFQTHPMDSAVPRIKMQLPGRLGGSLVRTLTALIVCKFHIPVF